jgi:penicillin-binding protein 1A
MPEAQPTHPEPANEHDERSARRPTKLVLHAPPPGDFRARAKKAAAFLAIAAFNAAALAAVVLYAKFSAGLPSVPSVQDYRPPILTELWTADGVLAAEFYDERRKVVPYERIPKKLVQAFIAAEDERFFDHPGFDPIGTLRAAFKTYVVRRKVQGGSSLTQQAAKAVLVSVELGKITEEEVRAEARRRLGRRKLGESPEAIALEAMRVKAELALKAEQRGERLDPSAVSDEALKAEAKKRLASKTMADDPDALRFEMLRVHANLLREAHARATEKTLRRKIRELILALRLEHALTKEEILYLYLNNVYLGHHSYGVQSAAENYFRKDVRALTLGEMTLLAGLPQAPTAYSPFVHPEAAKNRRHYVLRRMVEAGMITDAEVVAAEQEPLKVHPVEDVFHDFAPFFTEQVRRDIVARYGNERMLKDGLRVHLTMNSETQRAAQVAMLDGLIRVDKRQGFAGPLLHLSTEAEKVAFERKIAKKLEGEKLTEGHFYVGFVEKIESEGNFAVVNVGGQQGKLPIAGMRWARAPNPERYYPSSLIDHVKKALKPGDVIIVKAVKKEELEDPDDPRASKLPEVGPYFTLEQEPSLQGAIVSVDPNRQYVSAMIGGYDFDASEYNRAFQACRQPGSSFKPIIYSAALELLQWGVNHVLVDSPVVFDDEETHLRWKPENFGEDFKGDVLLRTAIIDSMNIPAVKTLHEVGVKQASDWAHKLGITTPINEDLSMALGGSCVHLSDMVNVYAGINRGGIRFRPTYVRKVEDRFGRALEDHTAFDDEFATFEERVAAGYARLFDRPTRTMKPETAFLITHLMREVVLHGTGAPAQKLGKPAAGKTGTTNDSFDTWFMGFTRDLVTGVWLGYDRYDHPLGKYETGGRASLPIWVDSMKNALADRPQKDWGDAPPDADIVWTRIDPDTGKLASPGAKRSVLAPFVRGTEPTDVEPAPGQVDSRDLMRDMP